MILKLWDTSTQCAARSPQEEEAGSTASMWKSSKYGQKCDMIQSMKPVKEQIFTFLKNNPTVYHGGALQRMDFPTRTGGMATGDNIKRRLNELVEEGKIMVSYNQKNEAMFSIKQEFKKKPVLIIDESKPPLKDENGRWRPQFKYAYA